jgi:hypothetical protein
MWLAADAIAGLSDGDPVGTWEDLSGDDRDATASGSERASWQENILNGLPGVLFDGSDDAYSFDPIAAMGDFSLFAVVQTDGTDAGLMGRLLGPDPQFRVNQTADHLSSFDGSNNPQSDELDVPLTDPSIIGWVRSGSTVTFYQNGTAFGTGTMAGSFLIDRLGALLVNTIPLGGYLHEVTFHDDVAFDAGEVADITDYFTDKWFGGGGTDEDGAGSSSITFAASGVGSSLADGVGSSSLIFTATGVGDSLADGAASSTIVFTASGVGSSLADASGTATLTFTVSGDTGGATGGKIAARWRAKPGGRLWMSALGARLWRGKAGGRKWRADPMGLVSNVIEEEIPGSGTVRLSMDFGDMKELIDGGVLDSCTITITGVGLTTLNHSDIVIENDYTASALFTGGSAGEYTVKWTPTILTDPEDDESDQTLPPRTATLKLV